MSGDLSKAPSLVDLEKLGVELDTPPEVAKFAPAKYRQPTTLSQTTNDMRKQVNDLLRRHDEYTAQLKAACDELLRIIG